MSKVKQAIARKLQEQVKANWQARIANAQRDLRYARERGDQQWIEAATVNLLIVQSEARESNG